MDQFQRHILDLAIWSRALIIGLKFNLPNNEEIFNRLIDETNDTEEIMATFFGLENATKYANYLLQFVTDLRDLTVALLTDNAQQANESYKNLYQIADNMAMFFTELDPSASLEQWRSLLYEYVSMLYNEIFAIVSDNYIGDIELFDRIVNHSYLIADKLSELVLSILHPAVNPQPTVASAAL